VLWSVKGKQRRERGATFATNLSRKGTRYFSIEGDHFTQRETLPFSVLVFFRVLVGFPSGDLEGNEDDSSSLMRNN